MRAIKILKNNPHKNYTTDIERIQDILFKKGFYASTEQCIELWEIYSEGEWAAGWLTMEGMTDEQIYKAIRKYFEEGPDSGAYNRYL